MYFEIALEKHDPNEFEVIWDNLNHLIREILSNYKRSWKSFREYENSWIWICKFCF